MTRYLLLIVVALLTWGCSQEPPAAQTKPATAESKTGQTAAQVRIPEHLLVFFIDPNGGPCRMQGEILERMSHELNDKVLIRPVQTTVPADRDLFYAYGIRALPTILLADAGGKEIKRLPPGVQSAEMIRELLNRIPAN